MDMTSLTSLWNRRGVRFGLVVLVVLGVVFGLLRYGFGYSVKWWLLSYEPERIRVESLDINPFTGKLTIRKLSVGALDAPALVVPEARLNLAVLPLLLGRRRVEFEYLTLTGAQVTFEQQADGSWRVAGLPLPATKTPKQDKADWELGFKQTVVSGSRIAYSGLGIRAVTDIDRAALTGRIRVQPRGTDVNLNADAVLDNLTVDSTVRNVRLLHAAKIKAEQIRVTGVTASEVTRIQFQDLTLGQQILPRGADKPATTPSLLSSSLVTLENVGYAGSKGLSVASVVVNDPNLLMRRSKQGRWYMLDDIRGMPATAPAASKKKPTEPTPPLRIGSIKISGKSRATFEDDSVEPPYHQTLVLREARLANLDSALPQQASTVAVVAQIGKYTHISLRGLLWPFTPRLTLDLKGNVESFDLPPLSPYTARELGYNLKSGHLNAEVQIRAKQGKLEGDNTLVLKNLVVNPVDTEKMKQLTKQLTMPLDSALSTLRDKDNNIKLSLPLKGDSSDPKFDLGDALNQALGKAMKTASLAYLKYYFQPYGTLITIAELADKATAVRLDPVFFPPGSAAFDQTTQAYLERVANLLDERPKLQLKICGIAVPADGAVVAEDLKALAQKRADVVKDRLVENHQVDPARLFVCHPEVSDKPDDRPRVDLSV